MNHLKSREELRRRLLRDTEDMLVRGRLQAWAFLGAQNWSDFHRAVAFTTKCQVAIRKLTAACPPAQTESTSNRSCDKDV